MPRCSHLGNPWIAFGDAAAKKHRSAESVASGLYKGELDRTPRTLTKAQRAMPPDAPRRLDFSRSWSAPVASIELDAPCGGGVYWAVERLFSLRRCAVGSESAYPSREIFGGIRNYPSA